MHAAVRIAVRESLRHKGRAALIVALIALPVMAMTFLDVLERTQDLSPDERANRVMGRADAVAVVMPQVRTVPPDPRWWDFDSVGFSGGTKTRDPDGVHLEALLPKGSQLTEGPRTADVDVRANDRSVGARAVVSGLVDDSTAETRTGLFRTIEGHVPYAAGDVAVSSQTAKRLGVEIGDMVTVTPPIGTKGGTPQHVRVVGEVVQPSCLECAVVFGASGMLDEVGIPVQKQLSATLITLPDGADPHRLWSSLAKQGVQFMPREAYHDTDAYQPYDDGGYVNVEAIVVGGVVTGFGLLEVMLLAGAAFAVGTKRQMRAVGLMGAAGATRRDVRRTMLAQGVVLGLVGAVVGLLVGTVAVVVTKSQWENMAGALFGGIIIKPLELLGIAAFGVLAGLLAALLPAIAAARMPVTDALAERFRPPRKPLRRPLLGLMCLIAGAVVSFGAASRTDINAQDATSRGTLPYVGLAVIGFGIMMIGVLLGAPALVSALGSLGHRMRLVTRMAVRDANRHRHRTAPAVAAVCLAVAGSVAIGFVITAQDRRDQANYEPLIPVGTMLVDQWNQRGPTQPAKATTQSVVDFVGGEAFELGAPRIKKDDVWFPCSTERDPCSGQIAVGSADALAAVLGRPLTTDEQDAVAAHELIVFGREGARIHDGTVSLEAGYRKNGRPVYRKIPSYVIDARNYNRIGEAMLTPAAARAQGFTTRPAGTFVVPAEQPSQDTEDRLTAMLQSSGASVTVERGYESRLGVIAIGLAGASALVTIAGVAIAVGLAAAEGRADLATLAAVGAEPRRRRFLAMAQAAVVGGIGCVVGIGFGTFIAAVMLTGFEAAPWATPWLLLLIVGVAVPILAMGVAGAFTRSRLPMVKRLA